LRQNLQFGLNTTDKPRSKLLHFLLNRADVSSRISATLDCHHWPLSTLKAVRLIPSSYETALA
jgi:hypothetical protein